MPSGVGTALAVSAGAQIISGVLAQGAAAGDRRAQQQAINKALDILKNQGYPPDMAKPLILEQYKAMGIYTPEVAKDVEKLSSAMEGVQENKEAVQMQLNALRGIAQRTAGMTPEDRAALMNVQDQMAQQQAQQQAAIQQSMQERGIAGGGAELAAQLAASQGSLARGGQSARDIMSQASQKALSALSEQGQMAGNIRSQDFAVQSAKAQSADLMNRLNVQNQMTQEQARVAAINQARQQDWANRQQMSNLNVGQANTETERQAAGKQWTYDANTARNQAIANAYMGQATAAGQRADRTAGQISGIGSALGNIAGQYGQYQMLQNLYAKPTTPTTPQVGLLAPSTPGAPTTSQVLAQTDDILNQTKKKTQIGW